MSKTWASPALRRTGDDGLVRPVGQPATFEYLIVFEKWRVGLRLISNVLLAAWVFLALPFGVALGHGTDCWTAGPGYTVSCGFSSPIWHQDNDNLGNPIEKFQMAATFSQTDLGSFDWQSVTIMNSWQCGSCNPDYGPTYFYASNPYSAVTQASWWQCSSQRFDYWQYDTRAFSPNHNPTTLGTWLQQIAYNGCPDVATTSHALNVNAY